MGELERVEYSHVHGDGLVVEEQTDIRTRAMRGNVFSAGVRDRGARCEVLRDVRVRKEVRAARASEP